jgi:hypothetical protein
VQKVPQLERGCFEEFVVLIVLGLLIQNVIFESQDNKQ